MNIRATISDFLERRSMRRYRSRVGWQIAPRYARYLERCRREAAMTAPADAETRAVIQAFRREGVTSFWTADTAATATAVAERIAARESAGEEVWQPLNDYAARNYAGDAWIDFPEFEDLFRGNLGGFLSGYFGTSFKILYGTMYRSEHVQDDRTGSQMWHSDSGPGICVNVMFYVHDTTPAEGPLEALPWDTSLTLYEEEKRLLRAGALDKLGATKRDRISAFYAKRIDERFRSEIRQPHGRAGLVVPFLNNTLHRGGHPAAGLTRTAIVFHCYPSHRPTDFARYRRQGVTKTVPYPADPAAEF